MNIIFENPAKFLTPKRLDYVVKYDFFKAILKGKGIDEAERVYEWHILKRTGGKERNSDKNCVADYVKHCHLLLESLFEKGFDKNYAVKIGTNGLIYDSGAHRIAATLALDIPIAVQYVNGERKYLWDYVWFSKNGMSEDDLVALQSSWMKLRSAKCPY